MLMDIRQITPNYAVAPQIDTSDMARLASLGFVAVINNRPDHEVTPELSSQQMRQAAEDAGLSYHENPVENGGLTVDMVAQQASAIAKSDGPVFAWCRSGTRSSIVWALSQAGKVPTDEILKMLSDAGYQLPQLGPQIDALAQQ